VGRHVDQPDGAPHTGDAPAGAHAVFVPARARGDDGRVERCRTSFGAAAIVPMGRAAAIASMGLLLVIQSRRGALR